MAETRASVVQKVTHVVTTAYSGDWKKAFVAFDKNEDGKIDRGELTDLLARCEIGYALTRPIIAAQILALMDTDNDGAISFEEFNTLAHVANKTAPKPGGNLFGKVSGITYFVGNTDALVTYDAGEDHRERKCLVALAGKECQLLLNGFPASAAELAAFIVFTPEVIVTVRPDTEYFGLSQVTAFTAG